MPSDNLSVGRSIYVRGIGRFPIVARPPAANRAFAGDMFPCTGCHTASGKGGFEAGWRVPDVRRATLGKSFAARVRQALSGSAEADNATRRMPHYEMNESDIRSLLAYLAVIGTAAAPEPGISPDRVRIGLWLDPGQYGCKREIAETADTVSGNQSARPFGRRVDIDLVTTDQTPEFFAVIDLGTSSRPPRNDDTPIITIASDPGSLDGGDCSASRSELSRCLDAIVLALRQSGRLLTRERFRRELRNLHKVNITDSAYVRNPAHRRSNIAALALGGLRPGANAITRSPQLQPGT